jgi:hypothetical protein
MFDFVEETFGIQTDDGLYLDCILVRSPEVEDEQLETIYVWVPCYPLTKNSLITCARQEIEADGAEGTVGYLVFDLRSTGESDGDVGDKNFDMDLHSISEWARERFGDVEVEFHGSPQCHGQANIVPLRAHAIMENYFYVPSTNEANGDLPAIIYLSSYHDFSEEDDDLCQYLAQVGFPVYGLDPMRYLLHASALGRVTPSVLWEDLTVFCQTVSASPIIIGQPLSAGLALLWTAGLKRVRGAIAIGEVQTGFSPWHIFDNSKISTFFLNRYVYRIAPRPIVLTLLEGHPLGGKVNEIAALYQSCGHPRRAERIKKVTPEFLLKMLAWITRELQEEPG